jgi:putative transposase
MRLAERHVITRADPRFPVIDRTAFASKTLDNKALYATRQAFFQDGSYPTYPTLYHQIKGEPEYATLPRTVAQWVLKQVCMAWQSYNEALAAWEADRSKFLDRPRIPRYKNKQTGRNLLVYTIQALSRPALRNAMVCPSMLPVHAGHHRADSAAQRLARAHYSPQWLLCRRRRLRAGASAGKGRSRAPCWRR